MPTTSQRKLPSATRASGRVVGHIDLAVPSSEPDPAALTLARRIINEVVVFQVCTGGRGDPERLALQVARMLGAVA